MTPWIVYMHEILLAEFSAITTFPEKEKGDVT
jgi:hypothetical protein